MIANKKVLNTANIQDLTNQNYPLYSADVFSKRQVQKADDSLIFSMSESKVIFTLIAKLALVGYAVHKGQSGDFTVTNYCLSYKCQNANELHEIGEMVVSLILKELKNGTGT